MVVVLESIVYVVGLMVVIGFLILALLVVVTMTYYVIQVVLIDKFTQRR